MADRQMGEVGAIGPIRAARGLGMFSIALGLAEIVGKRPIARWLGLEDSPAARKTLLAFGVREITAGAMALQAPAVSLNMWNRVGGDMMDAGALALALRSSTRKRAIAGALAFVGGAMVADVLTARALDRRTGRALPQAN